MKYSGIFLYTLYTPGFSTTNSSLIATFAEDIDILVCHTNSQKTWRRLTYAEGKRNENLYCPLSRTLQTTKWSAMENRQYHKCCYLVLCQILFPERRQ